MRVVLEKIPFYKGETKNTTEKIQSISRMSDSDIINTSIQKTQEDIKNSKTAKIGNMIYPATIGAFVLDDIIKTKGAPSIKLAAGGLSLASWLIFIKSFDVAGKISDKISKKAENENTQNTISLLGKIGGGFAIYTGISNLIGKGLKAMPKMPKLAKAAANFDKTVTSNGIAKSLNKNILKPIAKFAAEHPKLSSFVRGNSKLLIVGASILSSIAVAAKLSNKSQKTFEDNINNMYNQREEAKVASEILRSSQEEYKNIDNKIRFENERIIETAESNPKELDRVTKETLAYGK